MTDIDFMDPETLEEASAVDKMLGNCPNIIWAQPRFEEEELAKILVRKHAKAYKEMEKYDLQRLLARDSETFPRLAGAVLEELKNTGIIGRLEYHEWSHGLPYKYKS